MGTVTTLQRGRPFTRVDLDSMPDDGHRYELIDGCLIVSPAPSRRHQRVVVNLTVLLHLRCPEDLEVLVAPFDVALSDDSVLQPDLLVARRADVTDRDLPTAPLLAIEILSASTRHVDLTLKRARYEAAGCPSYWVVDPSSPSLTAWELRVDEYVEVAAVGGAAEFSTERPFAVSFAPADLIA